MKKQLIVMCVMFTFKALAQNVGINSTGAAPINSAALDVDIPNKGLLIPRVTLTLTTSFLPVTGLATTSLLVYSTGNVAVPAGYYYWDGAAWVKLLNSGSTWNLLGNSATNPASNFLGTTDAQDLVFRTNNIERSRFLSAGSLGIGTSTPASLLSVAGGLVVGSTYAGTAANAAPLNGLRVQGQTVINNGSLQDTRDFFSSYTSLAATNSVTGYPSVSASRAIAGYAAANGIGVLGSSNRTGYGVFGITKTGALSSFLQTGEAVIGQASGANGVNIIPISVHGIIDETVAGLKSATPVLGENNNATAGTGFNGTYNGSISAVSGVYGNIGCRGFAAGTDGYQFGVVGDILFVSGAVPDGSGGVLGSQTGTYGMLSYKGLTGTLYSVYGGATGGNIAAGNTGNRMSGIDTNNSSPLINEMANNTIGLGIQGGYLGSYIKGNEIGSIVTGSKIGLYVQGNAITTKPTIVLENGNGSNRIITYGTTSMKVQITDAGQDKLNQGEVFVQFSDEFMQLISPTEPIIVTVTATQESNNLFISNTTPQGFWVKESNSKTSSTTFNWQVIATKLSYQKEQTLPASVLSSNFDENFNKFLNSENNGSLPEYPMHFNNNEIIFERFPESKMIYQKKVAPEISNTQPVDSN